MFINYDENNGIQIRPYRNPDAIAGDIGDVAEALATEGCRVCCPLEGAKDALEDGAYWQGTNATTEALEDLHDAICRHEAGDAMYDAECEAQDAWDQSAL